MQEKENNTNKAQVIFQKVKDNIALKWTDTSNSELNQSSKKSGMLSAILEISQRSKFWEKPSRKNSLKWLKSKI